MFLFLFLLFLEQWLYPLELNIKPKGLLYDTFKILKLFIFELFNNIELVSLWKIIELHLIITSLVVCSYLRTSTGTRLFA